MIIGFRPKVLTRKDRLRRLIFEGSTKTIFEGQEGSEMILHFKDDLYSKEFDRQGTIMGKGVVNNKMSELLMTRLGTIGVPTHFMRLQNLREQVVRPCDPLPFYVVVRNVAAGTFSKRFGLEPFEALPGTLMEYRLRAKDLGRPQVTREQIQLFNWADEADLDIIDDLSARINDFLCGHFLALGLQLVDIRLEFGRPYTSGEAQDHEVDSIILINELSPDIFRARDMTTLESLDFSRFNADATEDEVAEVYRAIAKRFGVIEDGTVSRDFVQRRSDDHAHGDA